MKTNFLLTLPFIFVLSNNVKCVDLYKIKRLARDTQDVKIFSANHPPSVENYVPVAVIYDKEEDIPVLAKSVNKEVKSVTKENKLSTKDSTDGDSQSILGADEHYGNYSPDVSKNITFPVTPIKSVEEIVPMTKIENEETQPSELEQPTDVDKSEKTENAFKPKGRSLNYDVPVSTTDIPLSTAKNNIKESNQGRRLKQRVNKVRANKTLATKPNKLSDTEVKHDQEQVKSRNYNEPSTAHLKFQKRTGQRGTIVPIIESESYVYAYNGDYHYSYEGGDGTKAFERGELKTVNDGSTGSGVVGGFSYKDKDGNDFSLSYTADENGYRPVGAHLPTPPPIPIAIQRALALLATKTTPEPITERVKAA